MCEGVIHMNKKAFFLLVLVIAVFGLVACGGTTTEEKEVGSVEFSVQDDIDTNEGADAAEESSDVEEFGIVIADDDNVKATLVNVEHVVDDLFDEEKYVINIDIENKTENKVIVQARDVSIDGTMVDDMVFFSEEIAGDKNAKGKMEIQNYEGELPTMEDNIEFILLIIDDETFEDLAEHEVKIDF